MFILSFGKISDFMLRQHTIGQMDRHCHPLFHFVISYGLYNPSFGLTNWIDLFILSFGKISDLCWDSIQFWSDGWTLPSAISFCHFVRIVQSVITDCTIRHLVWPNESICSFCHLEKILNCAETAYNWSDGLTLPSAISVCHFVRMVQSVIWSDQLNRFVHFVIWKKFLILCWDSIQLVRWMDIAIRYFSLSFRTDCTIRHLVWPTESICSFCHLEKFLICAETAYNWSDGQTLPSAISFCHFVRMVQSVIWSDQLNRFVHFVIWKNFWFVLRQHTIGQMDGHCHPLFHFVISYGLYIQSVICSDQMNRFVHFVIWKNFWFVLRQHTIGQMDRHCHPLFYFVISYGWYNPSFGLTNWIDLFILSFGKISDFMLRQHTIGQMDRHCHPLFHFVISYGLYNPSFGLTNWIDLFILSFGKISDLCWDSIQFWSDGWTLPSAISFCHFVRIVQSVITDCTIRHLVWPNESICSFCHLEKILNCAETAYNWSDGLTLPSAISVCHFVRMVQSVIWSDQLNRFVHFVIWKNFWFCAETAYNWSDGWTLPSAISVCHFVRIVQSVIWCDQLNRFVHFVIWKSFWFVLRRHTIGQMDRHCHPLFHFVILYGWYNPSFGLTNWIDLFILSFGKISDLCWDSIQLVRWMDIAIRYFILSFRTDCIYNPSFALTKWIDLFILSFGKISDLCWDSIQLVRWTDIAIRYFILSFRTDGTIRHLVWPTESICSFCHLEKFLICAETAYNFGQMDGHCHPLFHFVISYGLYNPSLRIVQSVIWSDQINRFVHFVIWKNFWIVLRQLTIGQMDWHCHPLFQFVISYGLYNPSFGLTKWIDLFILSFGKISDFVLRQHTIGQMDGHCHPLFHFVISYGLYNPSFGLTNWIDLFILSFGKISDLCWDSIQFWSDGWTLPSAISFCHFVRIVQSVITDCTIRHLVWPNESICSFCHLEKILNCAETAYNWSDGLTLPSAISVCHFVRMVQSVIWSDQLNRFVHFVIWKNFWFCAETAYNWSDGWTLPSAISVCHFVRIVQSVIWCDQLNRFVHFVIWKSFWFVLRRHTIGQMDRHCHPLFHFVILYGWYNPSFGLTNWIDLFILSFGKISDLCWDSIQLVRWMDIAIRYFILSFRTDCIYNPSFALTKWIDLFILSFGKISDLCWDSIQLVRWTDIAIRYFILSFRTDGTIRHLVWPTESICSFCHLEKFLILCWDSIQLVRWTDIAIRYFILSFRTDCTIRHLVWPTESICSFCHLEKFLICAETAYNFGQMDGHCHPLFHFVISYGLYNPSLRIVQSVIWSDQMNRFVHFVIWKKFWIVLRQLTIGQMDWHCHPLFQFVISYGWYNPSFGLTNWIDLFILSFGKISDFVLRQHTIGQMDGHCHPLFQFVISYGLYNPSFGLTNWIDLFILSFWKISDYVLRQHTIGQMDSHCHLLFQFVISYGLYNPSFGLTNWIDLFILSFGKISDLCWDSIQLVRWTDIAIRYFILSFRTDCTIRHLVWPNESICSFCHLEKFLICAETAYNWSDGWTLPSAISFCHFVRIVQSVIWFDQLNRFVHFVIWKNFWFVLRQHTIGQMDRHCHPLFHFVISYGLYNPSFGLTNWIDLFILSFGKISDLCWDSIQFWSDGWTLPSAISFCHFVRIVQSVITDCTIRHLVWPNESICSFCHLEKFLNCAETAYNWSDGLTLPSAISVCHFVRIVQSVIWSDQMNRFVHFVIWKNFWFVLRQHTIGQMDRHCHPLFHFVISYGWYNPSVGLTNWIDLFILSFGKISDFVLRQHTIGQMDGHCHPLFHFVISYGLYIQSVICSDQMNRFVHFVIWKNFWFVLRQHTIGQMDRHCHPLFYFVISYGWYNPSFGLTNWIDLFILSFGKISDFMLRQHTIGQMDRHCHPLFHFVISYGLYNPSFGLTNWIDLFILSFGKISDLCWDSIQFWSDGWTLPSAISFCHFVRIVQSVITDCTIRHLVWPNESICSFCHLEKFLNCAETAYNWSDGLTLPSAISVCHFVRIVQSVIWSDQMNRFVHFVIWKNFWFVLRQHTIGQMDGHCHPLFHFVISYGWYNPSVGLTNWIDLFILSFGKISDLCWDSIQFWSDGWTLPSAISFCHFVRIVQSVITDCTIRHLVWPNESICSFCHLEKILNCAETAYNWSDGLTLPSAISVCHFVRMVQSVIWSDQLNRFVHFDIWKNFWFCAETAYNWSDGQTLSSAISFCHFVRIVYTIRHLVWPTESICSFCHFENFPICAEAAYNWSDGQTLPSAILFCHFVRMVQSVIWSDQLNRFVHFVIWKNFWFYAETAYNWSDGQTLPSAISFCHFVRIVQSVIWSDQLNRFVHFVIWKNFWFVLRQHTILVRWMDIAIRYFILSFVISYGLYNPSFGLTKWIDLFILSFGKISELCWDSLQLVRWIDIAIRYFSLSFRTDCTIRHLVWPTESICSFCHLEKFLILCWDSIQLVRWMDIAITLFQFVISYGLYNPSFGVTNWIDLFILSFGKISDYVLRQHTIGQMDRHCHPLFQFVISVRIGQSVTGMTNSNRFVHFVIWKNFWLRSAYILVRWTDCHPLYHFVHYVQILQCHYGLTKWTDLFILSFGKISDLCWDSIQLVRWMDIAIRYFILSFRTDCTIRHYGLNNWIDLFILSFGKISDLCWDSIQLVRWTDIAIRYISFCHFVRIVQSVIWSDQLNRFVHFVIWKNFWFVLRQHTILVRWMDIAIRYFILSFRTDCTIRHYGLYNPSFGLTKWIDLFILSFGKISELCWDSLQLVRWIDIAIRYFSLSFRTDCTIRHLVWPNESICSFCHLEKFLICAETAYNWSDGQTLPSAISFCHRMVQSVIWSDQLNRFVHFVIWKNFWFCAETAYNWSDGQTLPSAISFCHFVRIVYTIRHLVWPTESICSFCHLEKFLICAETAYNWSDGQTLPSAILFCHFVRMVQSVIWSDQLNRFVHFVIWKNFWFYAETAYNWSDGQTLPSAISFCHFVRIVQSVIWSDQLNRFVHFVIWKNFICAETAYNFGQMDGHCHPLFHFVISYGFTIRHLLWPNESICSFCHLEKFLICAETAYNWSDGQTLPSAILFCHFVRMVQSVIWSDQLNRFVHFVIWKNFWFYAETAYNWSDGQTLPSAISFCHFVRIVQSVIWSDQLNRFVHFVIWKNFWFVLRQHTILVRWMDIAIRYFILSFRTDCTIRHYGLYNPSFGLTKWIDLFILSFGKISELCWDSLQLVRWIDIAIRYFSLSFRTDCTIRHLVWPNESICSFCHLEKFLICAETAYNWSDGQTLPSAISFCHFVRMVQSVSWSDQLNRFVHFVIWKNFWFCAETAYNWSDGWTLPSAISFCHFVRIVYTIRHLLWPNESICSFCHLEKFLICAETAYNWSDGQTLPSAILFCHFVRMSFVQSVIWSDQLNRFVHFVIWKNFWFYAETAYNWSDGQTLPSAISFCHFVRIVQSVIWSDQMNRFVHFVIWKNFWFVLRQHTIGQMYGHCHPLFHFVISYGLYNPSFGLTNWVDLFILSFGKISDLCWDSIQFWSDGWTLPSAISFCHFVWIVQSVITDCTICHLVWPNESICSFCHLEKFLNCAETAYNWSDGLTLPSAISVCHFVRIVQSVIWSDQMNRFVHFVIWKNFWFVLRQHTIGQMDRHCHPLFHFVIKTQRKWIALLKSNYGTLWNSQATR